MKISRSLQAFALLILFSFSAVSVGLADMEEKLAALVEQLKSERSFEREQAAEALGYLGNPKAVEPLIKALNDPEKSVSDAAAQALENYDDPKAEAALSKR